MQTHVLPSGFVARTRGTLQGDSDSEITPFLRFSSINSLIFSRSTGECGLGRILIGSVLPALILNGSRFAGSPISCKSFGHLRLIHRNSRRGTLGGVFFLSPSGAVTGPSSRFSTLWKSIRCRDVDLSINDLNSSGLAIQMFGVGLAGQR